MTEATTNVATGGLVVLGDAGFAPDAEGFTILIAAEGPGSFAASGRYEVVAALSLRRGSTIGAPRPMTR